MELENTILDYQPVHYHNKERSLFDHGCIRYKRKPQQNQSGSAPCDNSENKESGNNFKSRLYEIFDILEEGNFGANIPCRLSDIKRNEILDGPEPEVIRALRNAEASRHGVSNKALASILYSKEEREYDPYVTRVGSASRISGDMGPF